MCVCVCVCVCLVPKISVHALYEYLYLYTYLMFTLRFLLDAFNIENRRHLSRTSIGESSEIVRILMAHTS